MIAQIVVFFRAKLMRKEIKILRFVPQKLRKSFANGNPIDDRSIYLLINTLIINTFTHVRISLLMLVSIYQNKPKILIKVQVTYFFPPWV